MPLKANDIKRLKQRLEEIKEGLNKTLGKVAEDVKSLDETKGYSQHQADEGTDGFAQTISIEVSSKEQTILRQVERALEKIDEGTYGICDVSGEEIPLKRLEAIPYAIMTVSAQDKYEKGLL